MFKFISEFFTSAKASEVFAAVRNFLKGKKTYIAATIMLLQAVLSYIDQTLALTSLSQFITWAQGLATNSATLLFAQALAIFGVRAAIKKTQKQQ